MKRYTLEQFQTMAPMYVDSVLDGLDRYPSVILDGNRISLYKVLVSLSEAAGYEHSYVDCYYYRISDEARENLQVKYPKEDLEQIKQSGLTKEYYFVQMTEELLSVLFKLSIDEMLFSTFYFPTLGVMVWGNYDKQFPVFFINEENKEKWLNKWC